MALACCQLTMAQRFTDQLDRGLVAVPTGSTSGSTTNMVTWRRLADEYYDVTYNLYKNGSKIGSNLTTTCYADNSNAYTTTTYQVAAVVNGVEQTKCTAVTPWIQYVCKLGNDRFPTAYIDIDLASVYDRNGNDVTANYQPNDAEMADLDGDGQLEIIIKRLNTTDAGTSIDGRLYSPNSTQFVVLDAYDVNWQTGAASLMWRIDCGPNMVSMNSTEIDIIAYDWDEDGKAEVVLRGADNMIVYGSDGRSQLYTIGDMSVNTRSTFNTTNAQYAWTHTGAEYLIYMNGQTGALYQKTDFPLKRLESNESKLKSAWGDDYGHRCNKFFFGAPFLDGRTASLFMARGIYTRHKMIAMNLDRSSHTWSTRWTWSNNSKGSAWYGQGNHNYVIADVDEDGRDEIVYGSMVIDDNGKGLSTTGLGHGDAMHVSDLDPYRKGLEVFACNEDKPNMNYRNATTSEIYYRTTGSEDDGRALMANFTDNYPGSAGRSVNTMMISSVSDKPISELGEGNSYINYGDLNFRIYWDGDLCSEILDSPGEAREAKVEKPGVGRLFTSEGCNMNNGSKNNPCFQGDIIGDWREEFVVRRGTGLRVYTSGIWTAYSMPSLWFDHQYRQAMVWQMMAYNQPPHLSFFLGDMEGITIAPPPLTTRNRIEIASGGTIATAHNSKHVLICDAASVGIAAAGVSPQVITVNVNSTVSGNDNNNSIRTTYNATQLGDGNGKGDITGATRLVKQGDGLLKLTAREFSYTGETNIWGGTLRFRGTLTGSNVWMNRHTSFYSGATIKNSLTMEYGATLYPSGDVSDPTTASIATTTIGTLNMHEGSRIVLQIDPAKEQYDQVNIGTLNVRTRSGDAWENYGPEYLKPVIEIQALSALSDGKTYTLGAIDNFTGNIEDIILEGVSSECRLSYENGYLMLRTGNEKVSAPTVEGDGKVKYITPGTSSLDNEVEVYYTTTATNNPKANGTKLEKNFIKMPNETTYYFYTVASSGLFSEAAVVTFDGVINESYPFQQWAGEGYLTLNTNSTVAFNIGEDHYYATSVSKDNGDSHSLNQRFGLICRQDGKGNNVYFWMRFRTSATNNNTGLFCNNKSDRKIAIMHLKPKDKFTITMSSDKLFFRNSVVYLESDVTKTKVSDGDEMQSGETYVVADDAGNDCYAVLGTNGLAYVTIKSIEVNIVSVDETVSAPTIQVTAAYEGMRTISITPGVGSQGTVATETYYTTDGSDPKISNSRKLFTEPFTISSTTTVKAVSYIVDDAGEIASQEIEAGTTLTLTAPIFRSTPSTGGTYNVVITSDQSSLAAAPSSINYFYTIDDVEILRCVEGQTVTVYGGQTIKAYAAAEGYNDSEEASHTYDIIPLFNEQSDWSIDFTTISGTTYPEDSSNDNVGGYPRLHDSTTGNLLNENFGVANNNGSAWIHNGGLYMQFSGNRNIAVNVTEGQYVRLRCSIAPAGSAGSLQQCPDLNSNGIYVFCATTSGVGTISIPRYTVIYSIEVFSQMPPVAKTITPAGWATYCSPYALDFSNPIDNLTQAYYVTGIKENGTTLTMLPITGQVPAGTGILLQGEGECLIPVLSGSPADTKGNLLVGVLEETVMEAKSIYVLLKENNVVGFYRNNKDFTVGANTAYLPADFNERLQATPSETRTYKFTDDPSATGISTPQTTLPIIDNHYYNLNGQRVSKPTKGIYIINGRKVIIRSAMQADAYQNKN